VTPELTRHLVEDSELQVFVQPSARRVFHDKEYVRAGASMTSDLSDVPVILGVKEIPADRLLPDTTYVFFSHVIKGQPANLPMLRRLKELGCTLIDYEMVRDDEGKRLIFFGRFAGLAGMIDSLGTLGRRLQSEGTQSPFTSIEPAHAYSSLDDAKAAVRQAGVEIENNGLPPGTAPLVVGVAGYGNVAKGVREILAELPTRTVPPNELQQLRASQLGDCVVQTTFKEEHLVRPRDSSADFGLQDYWDHPEKYRSDFDRYLPYLTVLMNCNYWDERYPRLVTKDALRALYTGFDSPRLRVIGDLGCDVGGAVECTAKCTDPGDPVFVWNPADDSISSGFEGEGPAILAVDILPSELPREASEEFSLALGPFLPALAGADLTVPFESLALPSEIRRAVILYRGEFTPEFRYLKAHLPA
jgi:alpha-aminoadipic semialdehyde synthase